MDRLQMRRDLTAELLIKIGAKVSAHANGIPFV